MIYTVPADDGLPAAVHGHAERLNYDIAYYTVCMYVYMHVYIHIYIYIHICCYVIILLITSY